MPLSAVRHGTKILQDLTQYLHEAGKAGDIEDPYFVQSLLQDCDVLEQIVVLLQEPIASIRDNSKLKQSLDPQLKPVRVGVAQPHCLFALCVPGPATATAPLTARAPSCS